MATHSSTLAWQIPQTEEPGGLQSMGSLGVGHNWATSFSLACIGEGNGNPLQYSCLEDPRDGGAWWATVSEVAQSRTWLKQLSSSSSSMFGGSFLNMSFLDNFFFYSWIKVKSVPLEILPLKHLAQKTCCLSTCLDLASVRNQWGGLQLGKPEVAENLLKHYFVSPSIILPIAISVHYLSL